MKSLNLVLTLTALLLLATPVAAQLPTGWFTTTIGTSTSGTASESSGTWTSTDANSQLGDKASSARLTLKQYTTDGSFSARVATMSATDPRGQACVLITQSPIADAKFAAMCASRRNGVSFVYRRFQGEPAVVIETGSVAVPVYLRITKTAYTLTGEYSTDGTTWLQLGSTRTTIPNVAWYGFATASRSTGSPESATFTNVQTTGLTAPASTTVFAYNGNTTGTGTWASPYTLEQALAVSSSYTWLRGGLYSGKGMLLTATNTTFKELSGEYVILDGGYTTTLTTNLGTSGCAFTVASTKWFGTPGSNLVPTQFITRLPTGEEVREDIRITNWNVSTGVVSSCDRGFNGTPVGAHTAGTLVRLIGATLSVTGAGNTLGDFEVRNSDPFRIAIGYPYSADGESQNWPSYRGPGISVQAANTNLFHLVVNNNSDGLSAFNPATNLHVYGSTIFNNGTGFGTTRGNGHGIYMQNQSGTGLKLIEGLISGYNFATSFKLGAVSGWVQKFTLQNNVAVMSGHLGARGSKTFTAEAGIEGLADSTPMVDVSVLGNFVIGRPLGHAPLIWFGYTAANNKNGIVTGNYALGGAQGFSFQNWQSLTSANNQFYITRGSDSSSTVAMGTITYTTQGGYSGSVSTLAQPTNNVTWASGDPFNHSWGSGCSGCPSTILINSTTYTITNVNDAGTVMTVTPQPPAGGGSYLQATGTPAAPLAGQIAIRANTYFSGVGLNDWGTTGSTNNSLTTYHFSLGLPGGNPSNGVTGGSVCSGGSRLAFYPNFAGADDCSWTRWSNGYDPPAGTGTVNRSGTTVTWSGGQKFARFGWAGETITIAGTPYVVASVTDGNNLTLTSGAGSDASATYTVNPTFVSAWTLGKPTGVVVNFYPITSQESGRGYVANIGVANWNDSATITLASTDLNTVLASGDKYAIYRLENFHHCGAPILTGTYTGASLTVPMGVKTTCQAIGHPFFAESPNPRADGLILQRF